MAPNPSWIRIAFLAPFTLNAKYFSNIFSSYLTIFCYFGPKFFMPCFDRHTFILSTYQNYLNINCFQWRIQDFPRGGHQPSGGGAWIRIYYISPQNCMNLRTIWWLEVGALGAPPIGSATGFISSHMCCIIINHHH